MKWTTVISIIIVLGLIAYFYFDMVKNRLEYKMAVNDIDVVGLIKNFNKQKFLLMKLNLDVKNKNNFSIKLKDTSLVVNYQGGEVLKTIDKDNNDILIERNSDVVIPIDISLNVDKPLINLIGQLTTKGKATIDYVAKFKLFFIPLTFRGQYEVKKSDLK